MIYVTGDLNKGIKDSVIDLNKNTHVQILF